MTDTPETEWIEEHALADQLKVDRSVLKKERPHLLAGEVSTKKNGAVIWLRTAAQRVTSKLGLGETPPVALAKKIAPLEAQQLPAGVEVVTVVNCPVNPNIVNARRKNGDLICVRVVDNKKYVPIGMDGKPMTMEARRAEAGNWWLLVGREPRWRGKF